jgi:outer membrane protein assembly factor BamB
MTAASSSAATGDLLLTLHSPFTGAETAFGSSVAIEGNQILVGNTRGFAPGAVHLFDATTGEVLHTFSSPTTRNGDGFGITLAFADNDILIGRTNGAFTGEVYRYDATTYELKGTFESPLANSAGFGSAIAPVPGTSLLAIGERGALVPTQPDRRGAIHLFDLNSNDFIRTIGNPDIQIVGRDTDSQFGYRVAAGSGFIVAGNEEYRAPDKPDSARGIAYLFDPQTGSLQHSLRLPAAFDPYGPAFLGRQVAADGNIAAVSQPGYVFLFNGHSGELLNIFAVPSPGRAHSLAVEGNVPYTGDYIGGEVFGFQGPSCCLPVLEISKSDAHTFGRSLAVDDGRLVVGDTGVVYVYEGNANAVPEPSTIVLAVVSIAFAGGFATMRRIFDGCFEK